MYVHLITILFIFNYLSKLHPPLTNRSNIVIKVLFFIYRLENIFFCLRSNRPFECVLLCTLNIYFSEDCCHDE